MARSVALVLFALAVFLPAAGAQDEGRPGPPTLPPAPEYVRPEKKSQPKTAQVKMGDLEDFALKAGRVTFNNFLVTEAPQANGFSRLRVRGTYRNSTDKALAFNVVLVGIGPDDEVLWAGNLTAVGKPNDVGCFDELHVQAPPGALKQTAAVRISAHVLPLPAAAYNAAGLVAPPGPPPAP
jgi:hypothetical protein